MDSLEEWAIVEEFPSYIVSNFGRVANESTGRILRVSTNTNGIPKVGLMEGGKQFTRAVCVLVAEAFVDGMDDISNTPTHLDTDQMNNHAYNLVWRPRWFAWKYKKQFSNSIVGSGKVSIIDIYSNQVYSTMIEAAMLHGLLLEHIWRSVSRGYGCFPTGQVFKLTS